jgi:hypothetical protein
MKKTNGTNASLLPADLALVHVENKPAFFARVERIDPDLKAGWWRIRLLILNLPLKVATWVLDNEQIRGAEFTMGGVPVRLEKIMAPADVDEQADLHPQMNGVASKTIEQARPARILAFKPRPGDVDESA